MRRTSALRSLVDLQKLERVPQQPERDILGFFIEHAPLRRWQRDILSIIREESYYFVPQRMTKIMNEGWASFWHRRMLTRGLLDASEIVVFADCHSAATMTSRGKMNPY